MFTSSSTRSNAVCAARRSASSPSAADVTSKPALLSDIRTMSRIDAESSAARMRIMRRPPAAGRQSIDSTPSSRAASRTTCASPSHSTLRCCAARSRTNAHSTCIVEVSTRSTLPTSSGHRPLHRRDARTASASTPRRPSRCSCLQARSWAASARRSGSLDNRSASPRHALPFRLLVLIRLVRADFTDSLAVSAFAVVA